MSATNVDEARRADLLRAVVAALEGALPEGTPERGGSARRLEDVLVGDPTDPQVAAALAQITKGAGGELRPTASGQVRFFSAESSALMALNLLTRSGGRGLPGVDAPAHDVTFEREMRVAAVRAPVGPTLDAVFEMPAGTVAVEAKTAEPWRSPPKAEISAQYDGPAAALGAEASALVEGLRGGSVAYRYLDAAQLVKHALGLHSALQSGAISGPVTLVLLYWRPNDVGPFKDLFDALEGEFDNFARRIGDAPIVLRRVSSSQVLQAWNDSEDEALRTRAEEVARRYDTPLR